MNQYGILMFRINMDIKSINLESYKQKITAKQSEFARLVAEENLTSSDAYRFAYKPEQSVDNKSIHEMACRVMKNVKVQSRISSIKDAKSRKNLMKAIRREDYIIKKLIKEVEEGSRASGRIRALELLGKTVSLFKEKTEINIPVERTSEEVSHILKIKLAEFLNYQR